MSEASVWLGDCLELLRDVRERSVSLVLCDLPYGITNCRWDRKVDAARLWSQYERVLTGRGAVVLFAQGRFMGELMATAPRNWFRHDWVWDKRSASGWLNARRMPMRGHENVLVFGRRMVRYFPQGLRRCARVRGAGGGSAVYRGAKTGGVQTRTGWPTTMLRFARGSGLAACEKPVALLDYLIRTYTRRGEMVLDNTMGLGGTGVAAVRSGRRFIGMEIDRERFETGAWRILEAMREAA